MKVVKSLFLAFTLTILGYSAVQAGAVDSLTEEETALAARRCCTFQVDCLSNQTCTPIDPHCSADKIHICVKNKTAVEVDEVTP